VAGEVRVAGLTKRFGALAAVDSLTLGIEAGQFFTFLGPSGCGKTTTLRMIGGLEKPDAGEITVDGRVVVSVAKRAWVPPERREMGMVFQSYAIWPHMTVGENVAYPLKLRHLPRQTIREKVRAALELVGLEGLENRQAPMLSGGQQQRVALARALVFEPKVLLLDEPLSNLDALLRDEMRRELKSLQRRVGVTVIFVTHDQVEALSLSDRIAIMNHGHLEQVGTPEEVYRHPATAFAQTFLGKTFTLPAVVGAVGGSEVRLELPWLGPGAQVVAAGEAAQGGYAAGQAVTLATRPEKIKVHRGGQAVTNGANRVPARVEAAHFLGDHYEYTLRLAEHERVINLPDSAKLEAGDTILLEFHPHEVLVWPG
jgi:ABC-type Fe3+/spermidine/putrescine transport system ATPase subunit